MGKVVKRVVGGVVDAAKNAPKTIGKTAVDMGKSVIGQNSGNYFKNLGESVINTGVVASTYGMTGTKDLGGTNNMDTQIANLMGKGGDIGTVDTTEVTQTEDPNLKAEQENAAKKGRASNILAGSSDTVGTKSAKKTLLGSL